MREGGCKRAGAKVIVRAGIKVDIGTFADKIRVRVGTNNKCHQDN